MFILTLEEGTGMRGTLFVLASTLPLSSPTADLLLPLFPFPLFPSTHPLAQRRSLPLENSLSFLEQPDY